MTQIKTAILQKGETLFLQGDINFYTVALLLKQLENLLTDNIKSLDCSGINQVDSSAVSLLIHSLTLTRNRALPLKINGVNHTLQSLINLYEVDDFLL